MSVCLVCRRSRVESSRLAFFFMEIGHEIISAAIFSPLLIQEGQLSVTGKECALITGNLPRNSVDKLTDRARNDLKSVDGP